MSDKEKREIAPLPNQEIATQRVCSDIQSRYTAMQIMIGNKINTDDDDEVLEVMEREGKKHGDFLQSLGANDTLMVMLATQMASIHELQQNQFLFARKSSDPEKIQYHTNTVAKLTNVFIQQANLMHKLQGRGQQKVVVEHVHVNEGGQAIVGNVEGVQGGRRKG